MLKRKHKFLSIIMGISLLFLTGCGRDSVSDSMESVNISDTDNAENDITEAEDEADDTPIVVPQLPDTGSQLADFVCHSE